MKKKIYKHSQSELSIQKKVLKKLQKAFPDAFIIKLSDKWYSGIPDVMMIRDGIAFFYEIKSEKGVVSEIQKDVHIRLRRAGAFVDIVRGGEYDRERTCS